MSEEIVVISDVHGCIDELDELLKIISYNKSKMRLIFVGDLVDRGPDSIGVVRRVQELGAECVLGNHEDKHIRWRKHENIKKVTGKPNPMNKISRDKRHINDQLTDDDIDWMRSFPIFIDLGCGLYVVHGGCVPGIPFSEQRISNLLRARYINEDGNPVSLTSDKKQPPNTEYWAKLWRGPESIIYGHNVNSESGPRIDTHETSICFGIDTGCCFGGNLTAMIIHTNRGNYPDKVIEFASVMANEIYYNRRRG